MVLSASDYPLKPHPTIPKAAGPVLVCILDGYGNNKEDEYNAVYVAETPVYDRLKKLGKERFRCACHACSQFRRSHIPIMLPREMRTLSEPAAILADLGHQWFIRLLHEYSAPETLNDMHASQQSFRRCLYTLPSVPPHLPQLQRGQVWHHPLRWAPTASVHTAGP